MGREADAIELIKIYDGVVTVRSADGEYIDTADNYALDQGRAFPATPAGFIGRTFVPAEKHNLHTGQKNEPQSLPWGPGINIIAQVAELLAAKAAREAVAPPADPGLNELYNLALESLINERATEPTPPQAVLDYIAARDG